MDIERLRQAAKRKLDAEAADELTKHESWESIGEFVGAMKDEGARVVRIGSYVLVLGDSDSLTTYSGCVDLGDYERKIPTDSLPPNLLARAKRLGNEAANTWPRSTTIDYLRALTEASDYPEEVMRYVAEHILDYLGRGDWNEERT